MKHHLLAWSIKLPKFISKYSSIWNEQHKINESVFAYLLGKLCLLPYVTTLLKYMCAMGLNLHTNGHYLGRWKLTGVKKDMGQGLMPYTRLSDLFHPWPMNRSDMRKLVSVLFLANGRISQTCVIYRAVWSIPSMTTEQVKHEKNGVCLVPSYWQN